MRARRILLPPTFFEERRMLKPEVDCLVPHVPFNRRTFIKAALGTGFAAAVLPVSAQTIHTDRYADTGLSGAAQGQDASAGDPRRA
jgi:TAT (twin-arginine translocation) pathway signal sequence